MKEKKLAAANKLPTRIKATVTIEGPAEDILADVQRLRGGQRRVSLSTEPRRGYLGFSNHYIPDIKGGHVQDALEKLEFMSKQTVIDSETEQRLERLIRDFGIFTDT